MARLLSIDYGTKKTGIAVSDPLQIICSPLETVPTNIAFDFISDYLKKEDVECIVVGDPRMADGQVSSIHHFIVGFVRKLKKAFPEIEFVWYDERFSSQRAKEILLQSGAKKKKRKDKSLIDKLSASIILQDYMEENRSFL